ncbi:MAG: AlpA family phage regulatory protein [Paracoccaceae bacterium]
MQEAYLSDRQLAVRFGVHRMTPWRWLQTLDGFPKAVRLSPGCTRWKLSEIEAWEKVKAARVGA